MDIVILVLPSFRELRPKERRAFLPACESLRPTDPRVLAQGGSFDFLGRPCVFIHIAALFLAFSRICLLIVEARPHSR